ncbi:GDSL-type esterase/lipase family protein [Thalassoglobus sp. JC818]|uniref:GDSL-type esterase/lipase family protein n=1 Tax=Thalassoglobus sp. JC818 TaxID=3232136 RepID=UPI00345820CF
MGTKCCTTTIFTIALILFGYRATEAQVDTSRSYSFGDSLTDNEFAYLFFPPELNLNPAIYGADPFEGMFQKAAGQNDILMNFAAAGATSAQVLEVVKGYVAARKADAIPPATLISLEAGGNDFLTTENIFALSSAAPGENVSVDQIVDDIRKNLMSALQMLRKSDKPQFVLWTVPDVTLIPYVLAFGLSELQTANLRGHIMRLNQFIRAQGNRADIAIHDLASVLLAVSLYPPTVGGIQLDPTPDFGEANDIFADPFHPTAVSNALLANDMIEGLNKNFGDDIPYYTESELADLTD